MLTLFPVPRATDEASSEYKSSITHSRIQEGQCSVRASNNSAEQDAKDLADVPVVSYATVPGHSYKANL